MSRRAILVSVVTVVAACVRVAVAQEAPRNQGTLNASGVFSGNLSVGFSVGFDYYTRSDFAKAKGYRRDLMIKSSNNSYHQADLGDRSNYWHVKQRTLIVQGPIPRRSRSRRARAALEGVGG